MVVLNFFWGKPDFIIKWAIYSKLYDMPQMRQKIALGPIKFVTLFKGSDEVMKTITFTD